MIWVPLPGGGPTDGYRYREALRPLHVPELTQAYEEALHKLSALAVDPGAELDEWHGHGPALSAYAMWAVYALRDHGVLDSEETKGRLKQLATYQLADVNGPYRGIHYGKTKSWEAPPWWGGPIHVRHQVELIALAPHRYSEATFSRP